MDIDLSKRSAHVNAMLRPAKDGVGDAIMRLIVSEAARRRNYARDGHDLSAHDFVLQTRSGLGFSGEPDRGRPGEQTRRRDARRADSQGRRRLACDQAGQRPRSSQVGAGRNEISFERFGVNSRCRRIADRELLGLEISADTSRSQIERRSRRTCGRIVNLADDPNGLRGRRIVQIRTSDRHRGHS